MGTPPPAVPPEGVPRLTPWRLLAAYLLTCALFFVVLVVFAFAGLGQIGLAPAIVIATVLAGRATRVRRAWPLVAVGALSFVTMVAIVYTVAIVVLLNAPHE